MHQTDPFHFFTDKLNLLGVRYMVTGSVAGIVYGEPRLTQDVDIVLELPSQAIGQLCGLFPAEEYYCPPVEVLRIEAQRPLRGHFNLIHQDTGYKADIYLRGNDALHAWALDHARKLEMDSHAVWIAPPEYVIIRKLQYFQEGRSEKHLRDIQGMLAVSGATIDHDLLGKKIAELGLQSPWQTMLEFGKRPK